MQKPIKTYSLSELVKLFAELDQPSFRAKQVAQWLYVRHVSSYDDMTNLPLSLRHLLTSEHPLFMPAVIEQQISRDGTRKYLLAYHDGAMVETVAIPSHDGQRLTVCFSTQAGCPMACCFCATGREGFHRNLAVGEIVDQVLIAQEDMGIRVSNLVGMGQGEPFLNYENVLSALHIFNHPDYLAIGARHITISTCGIVPMINRFSQEKEQFTLAVSLHAAKQEVRDVIMPNVVSFPLASLKIALLDYVETTNRRVTLEYVMLSEINDTESDLEAFRHFCSGLLCHVNLIPLNSVEDSVYVPSSRKTVNYWKNSLNGFGIETTIRESRGSDIQGACGQLRNSFLSPNA